MIFNQSGFDIRCEWSERGVAELVPSSDVVIIIDVFSFSTCVEIAVAHGATVYPYIGPAAELETFAAARNAEWVGMRDGSSTFRFSPTSLQTVPAGMNLVLPSRNGSMLSLQTGATPTLAGCLRNARAVAQAAQQIGRRISVIPGGERWKSDDTLRPAYEDLLGAGAILSYLQGNASPEARAAAAAFRDAEPDLLHLLHNCSSGREMSALNRTADIELTAQLNISTCVPILIQNAYRSMPQS